MIISQSFSERLINTVYVREPRPVHIFAIRRLQVRIMGARTSLIAMLGAERLRSGMPLAQRLRGTLVGVFGGRGGFVLLGARFEVRQLAPVLGRARLFIIPKLRLRRGAANRWKLVDVHGRFGR